MKFVFLKENAYVKNVCINVSCYLLLSTSPISLSLEKHEEQYRKDKTQFPKAKEDIEPKRINTGLTYEEKTRLGALEGQASPVSHTAHVINFSDQMRLIETVTSCIETKQFEN